MTLPDAWKTTVPKVLKLYGWVVASGRLKPGVKLAQAQAELAGLKIGDSGNAWFFQNPVPELTQERDPSSYPPYFRMIPLFLGAVLFVYAIACTNAINLMFARSISRRHELGVRLALGGSRRQIMRLLLTESFLLSVCAGVAGIFIARWCGALVCSYLNDSNNDGFNHAPLGIVIILVCITGVLVGVIPAWRAGRANLSDTLKTGPNSLGMNRTMGFLRESLVVIQMALVIALLAGAGLMLQSLIKLNRTGVGFDPRAKVAVGTYLPFDTPVAKYIDVTARLKNELEAIPGIKHVSVNAGAPLGGNSTGSFKIDGRPELGDIPSRGNHVSPEFFPSLGMTLIKGRGFEGVHPSDSPVAIVNETMEKRYFTKEGALGKFLDLGRGRVEIIGVVNDSRETGPRELVIPQIYQPLCQVKHGYSICCLLELQSSSVPGLEAAARRAAYRVDPTLLITVRSLEDSYREAIATERFTLVLLQVFSVLSLVLATLGLFSVMAYNVAQRRGEFGLRMALGATPDNLLRSVLGRGLRTVAIGIVIGLVLAFSLTRFLQSLLYQTSPLDPLTYSIVVLLLLAVALIACWLPARHAAKIDPMVALRCE